eukprot:m.153156 g.153156  ORF g.153156 m.153156 type:complete len:373 (+) comp52854_c0_seq1:1382-2500(+)
MAETHSQMSDYTNPWGDNDPLAAIVNRGLANFKGKPSAQPEAASTTSPAAGSDDEPDASAPEPEPQSDRPKTEDRRKKSRSRSPARHQHGDRRRSRSRSPLRRRRSRSRSPSKHHRRSRSRSPSKHHRRSRSRSPSKHHRRSRSRSPSRRHRSRSRSPSRHRHSDSHSRSDRHSHHKDKHHDRREKEKPADDDVLADTFTAAVVVEHFLEVYGGSSKLRVDQIFECVNESSVVIADLQSQDELVPNAEVVRVLKSSSPRKAEASKRLFIESENKKDPSFALDLYLVGSVPNFGQPSLSAPSALLYSVRRNQIEKIWVLEDTGKLAETGTLIQEALTSSPLYEHVLDAIVRPGGLTAKFSLHFNNYSKIERWG